MRFRRWVVFTFLVHALIVVVDKGAGLILFKILEDQPDVKGAADMLTTLPSIMMSIANLGLATSTVYFLRRKVYEPQVVAEATGLVAVVWGGAFALVAILASQYLLPLVRPNWDFDLVYVAPIALCVPFLLTASYLNSVQLAVDKIRDYSLVQLISSLIFLPLFLLFYYGFSQTAPTSIAFARLAAAAALASITIWMLRNVVRWRPRYHRAFLHDGIRYGWIANLVSVLTYLNHRVDLYLVPLLFVGKALLGPEELREAQLAQAGFYSLAVTFAELVWHFPEATRDLFFSKVAGSTHEEARVFTPVLCRLCLTIAVVGACGMLLLIDPVMTLISPEKWGEKWSATVLPCLAWLVPGTATYTVAKILQNDLAARGHLRHCLVACVLVLVTMTGLDVLWIPTQGAIGAAKASSLAYVVSSVYSLLAYRACGGAGLLQCLVPRRADLEYARELGTAILAKVRKRK